MVIPYLKEVIGLHCPDLVYLCETKNKNSFMEKFKKKLRYDKLFFVNPNGRAGGLAIMWKNELKIEKILFTHITIEFKIPASIQNDAWWCVCLYASKDDQER